MPLLSTWMVRLSLAWLVAGTLIGSVMLAAKGVPALAAPVPLLPAHVEMLLVGWLVQLALGVAYWILPRVGGARPRAGLALGGTVLLNLAPTMALLAVVLRSPAAHAVAAPAALAGTGLLAVHLALRVAARRRAS